MYNGLYFVLFLPVFLSAKNVFPNECTIKASVAEIAIQLLPWHFDMAFGTLVLKCSSNFLGVPTQGSENRFFST